MPRNPLNDLDVSGNTMAWMAEQNEGVRHIDHYLCPECKCIVKYKEWNEKKNKCYDCCWGIK